MINQQEIVSAIEHLLNDSGITLYRIGKDTGINDNTLRRYTTGTAKVENMSLVNGIKLYNYYLEEMEEMTLIEKLEALITGEGKVLKSNIVLNNDRGREIIIIEDDDAETTDEMFLFETYSEYEAFEFLTNEELFEEEETMEIIKNIKRIIEEIENGTIELENLDPNYHEIEYIDGASDHYIIHEVEGQEGLEVFFAEHDHIKEVRDDIYENGKDEVEEFEKLTINEYADQYDYDEVVAYRYDGGEINWI